MKSVDHLFDVVWLGRRGLHMIQAILGFLTVTLGLTEEEVH
jgi:heme A synthase